MPQNACVPHLLTLWFCDNAPTGLLGQTEDSCRLLWHVERLKPFREHNREVNNNIVPEAAKMVLTLS